MGGRRIYRKITTERRIEREDSAEKGVEEMISG